MAILKKIKSATLVEALIATVLIVLIFMIASLTMNNLLLNNVSKNTHAVETRLNLLEYQLANHQISLPYNEVYEDWEITLKIDNSNHVEVVIVSASQSNTIILKKRINAEQ